MAKGNKHFENTVETGENVAAISPILQMFSEVFILWVVNPFPNNKLMGECNTILSAYTKYRHLG